MMPTLIGMGLRAILPSHLDWIAKVAVDIVDTVEDSIAAGQDGWSEADSKALRLRIDNIAGQLEHGIREAVQAVPPKRQRWGRR
jgi:RNA-binding protein YlmH